MGDVMLTGFRGMMLRVNYVPVCRMRMMGCLFMITSLVMRRRFAMMFRGMLVMLGRMRVVLCRRMFIGHLGFSL